MPDIGFAPHLYKSIRGAPCAIWSCMTMVRTLNAGPPFAVTYYKTVILFKELYLGVDPNSFHQFFKVIDLRSTGLKPLNTPQIQLQPEFEILRVMPTVKLLQPPANMLVVVRMHYQSAAP